MSLINKPFTFSTGQTINASDHNSNYDTIYNDYNGNISDANIAANAGIQDSKIAQIVTSGKVSGAALTLLGSTPSNAGVLPMVNGGYPIGSPFIWPGTSAPTGAQALDGSAISRTTYPVLFARYGTTYGVGDGSTTFNVPDWRGLTLVGYKSGDSDFGTLGNIGGEKTHLLTTAEMPSHNHTFTGKQNGGGGGTSADTEANGSAAGTITTSGTGGDGHHNNLQPFGIAGIWVTLLG